MHKNVRIRHTVDYFDSMTIASEEWFYDHDHHKDGEPALREFFANGQPESEGWYQHGSLHRIGSPAFKMWDYKTGNQIIEEWRVNGNYYRTDGPAYIVFSDEIANQVVIEEYYNEKGLHREDGPAIVRYEDGSAEAESWFLNNIPFDIYEFAEFLELPFETQVALKLLK